MSVREHLECRECCYSVTGWSDDLRLFRHEDETGHHLIPILDGDDADL